MIYLLHRFTVAALIAYYLAAILVQHVLFMWFMLKGWL